MARNFAAEGSRHNPFRAGQVVKTLNGKRWAIVQMTYTPFRGVRRDDPYYLLRDLETGEIEERFPEHWEYLRLSD